MNATLVLGGTRSGKSRYAEALLGDGPARYLATARRIPGDAEWDARIAAHADRRPPSWTTVEITSASALASALGSGGPVLVDDLGTWLTGLLDDTGAWDRTGPVPEVDDAVAALVGAVAAAPGRVVLVSAEVGLGVVPETRSGRVFRDRLGELNAALAEVCAETVLVVAGRALPLPGPAAAGIGAADVGPADAGTGAVGATGAAAASPAGAAGTTGATSAAGADSTAGAAGSVVPAGGATDAAGAVGAAGAAGSVGGDAADTADTGDAVTADGEIVGTPAGVPGAVRPETSSPEPEQPGTAEPEQLPADAEPAGGTAEEPVVATAVGRPDLRTRRAAVALLAGLAAPTGGLGRLGELGAWLASCQAQCPPSPPVDARVLLLAADHGVARLGVSAYPPEVSAARASAAAAGRLPVTVAARAAGAAVRVVDVGLADGADGAESGHVVVRGSGRIDREDALTDDDAAAAWRTGRLLADAEIDAGADVLVPATLSVGVTTPAATLVAALTGTEPVAVVGRASGIDDRAWMRKAVVIRDALRRARPHLRDPLALLRTIGGTDLVVLAGFLARAAERRVPAVLDGLAVGAAALLAEELAPGAKEWWVAAQPSTEPAAALVLEQLSLTPVLDLAVRTEDGTAGVAVLPLLVTAARLVAETGTAQDTGIVPGEVQATADAGR